MSFRPLAQLSRNILSTSRPFSFPPLLPFTRSLAFPPGGFLATSAPVYFTFARLLRTRPAHRQIHSSALAARAPVPNPQSPLVPNRSAGSQGDGKKKSNSQYGLWYGELFPGAMIPIFLLATAIFLSLALLRTHLSHNRSLSESTERIVQLEAQLARLRAEAKRRQERERRERERILPLVVERVLQRVGAMGPEEEEIDEPEETVLLV